MQIWVESSYKNLFRDEKAELYHTGECQLVMARNEGESFQIALRSDTGFSIRSVTFTPLVCGDAVIEETHLSYGFVQYEYLTRNSMNVSAADVVRTAPDWFPDAISNDRSVEVEPKSTQPVWVTVSTPKTAAPGLYRGWVTVHTNLGEYRVPLTVELCDVTIPDTNQAAFTYMHHQQITGTWWLLQEHDAIYRLYGYQRWTQPWWQVVGDIAEKMRSHRQNSLYINIQHLLLDGGTTVDESGAYSFRWSKLDEYIDFFVRAGVVKQLEGTHLTGIDYATMDFNVFLLRRGEDKAMTLTTEPYDSPAALNWLRQYLPALQAHIEEMGWLDIWYQHVGDEAMNDRQLAQYRYVYEKTRRFAPGLKIGDPVTHVEFAKYQLDAGVDVIVPIEDAFDNNRKVFEDAAARGVRVFLYNCCGPAGGWLNRFVDKPVWNMRSLAWLLYGWNIDGYLHWGYNFWTDWTMDEFLTIAEEAFKGDHYTIYPDPHSNRVRSSIRYESNRDAAEDFELLTILGRRNPEKAKELVAKIASDSCSNYNRNISEMIAVRAELVRAAAGVE